MKIEEAFDRIRECLSGARFVEGLEAMDVIRSHVGAKMVVTDEMRDAALKSWMGESLILPFAGESRMRSALQAALDCGSGAVKVSAGEEDHGSR